MHHIVEFFIILFIRLVIFVLLNCFYMPLDFSLYPKGEKSSQQYQILATCYSSLFIIKLTTKNTPS